MSSIEMDADGKLFDWESQYHPQEHRLQLSKQDVVALPEALRRYNGFYSRYGDFVFLDSIRILLGYAIRSAVVMLALLWRLVRYVRRRRASFLCCADRPSSIVQGRAFRAT